MPHTIHIQDVIDSPVTILAVAATPEETLAPDARFLYENSDSYTTAARFFHEGNIVVFKNGADIRLFHASKENPVQFLTLDEYILAQGKAAEIAAFFEKYTPK